MTLEVVHRHEKLAPESAGLAGLEFTTVIVCISLNSTADAGLLFQQ